MLNKSKDTASVLKEISNDTTQWIRSIQNQKSALNSSANTASEIKKDNSATTTSSSSSPINVDLFQEEKSPSSIGNENAILNAIDQSSEDNGGGEELPTFIVDVCINGEPRQALIYGTLL